MIQNGLDPQVAIALVAVIGAVSHAVVAVLRAIQDYRVGLMRARNGSSQK